MESFLVTCTSNTCERPVLNLLCWPAQAIWDELTHIITKAKKSIKMKDGRAARWNVVEACQPVNQLKPVS